MGIASFVDDVQKRKPMSLVVAYILPDKNRALTMKCSVYSRALRWHSAGRSAFDSSLQGSVGSHQPATMSCNQAVKPAVQRREKQAFDKEEPERSGGTRIRDGNAVTLNMDGIMVVPPVVPCNGKKVTLWGSRDGWILIH